VYALHTLGSVVKRLMSVCTTYLGVRSEETNELRSSLEIGRKYRVSRRWQYRMIPTPLLRVPLYPQYHLCIHSTTFVSTVPPLYPQYHLCIHSTTFVSTIPPLYPQYHLCIHSTTFVSTVPPLYPQYHLCIHSTCSIQYASITIKLNPIPMDQPLTSLARCTSPSPSRVPTLVVQPMDTPRGTIKVRGIRL
jgi:hypothetical protein